MNIPDSNGEDVKVSQLLRKTRPAPALPLRFQENVWRRIETEESSDTAFGWLDSLIGRLLRPRFALPALTLLILMGTVLGTYEGQRDVRQTAEARYLASVAPSSLH